MTTLIFATHDDASPLIHILGDATQDEVRAVLRRLADPERRARCNRPDCAAAEFFRLLSADEFDEWDPRLESTPIFNIEGCLDVDDPAYPDLIAWNPATWSEWDLDALYNPEPPRDAPEDVFLSPSERAAEEQAAQDEADRLRPALNPNRGCVGFV